MIYWIAHGLFFIFSKIFFPIKTTGNEFIPPGGRVIFASNHLSNMDPMIIGLATGCRLSYVAKESLFKNQFFSFFLHHVGAFPIRRDSSDISAIKEALKRLKSGGSLVIFPEGTRKGKEGEKKIQPGIALLAVKSDAYVIPTFIQGSEKVLPPGAKWVRRSRVTVTFGSPVSYSPSDPYQEIANQIMGCINRLASL